MGAPSNLPTLLAAHPRFVWASGIVDTDGDHVILAPVRGSGSIACMAGGTPGDGEDEPPPSRWIVPSAYVPLDLAHPATTGVLLAALLTDDPTARVSIEPREVGHLFRITVTAADGRRCLVTGHTLDAVLPPALLAVWGPA